MIVQRILAYCDIDGCLEAHTIVPSAGKPLTMRAALGLLREAGWAVSAPDAVRCPLHKHMKGRRSCRR